MIYLFTPENTCMGERLKGVYKRKNIIKVDALAVKMMLPSWREAQLANLKNNNNNNK